MQALQTVILGLNLPLENLCLACTVYLFLLELIANVSKVGAFTEIHGFLASFENKKQQNTW